MYPQSTPDGPSAGRVARWTLTSAPCAAVRNPLFPLRSVAQYPGFAALTLTGVSRSSLAYITVTMFSAVLDEGYGMDAIPAIGPRGRSSRRSTRPRWTP